jgi:hypothetical protein
MPMPMPRRQKTPQQLKRIQNRTQRFKAGEVHQNRQSRNLNVIPPMPDHAFRSDVTNISSNNDGNIPTLPTTTIVSSVPDLPPAAPESRTIPDFLVQLEKMEELRSEQRRELMASAVLCRAEFPLMMIDRGVLHSEIPKEESNFPLDDIPFDPTSIRITTIQGGKLRSVAVVEKDPIRGPFIDKNYIFVPPKNATGFSKSQTQRILAKFPGSASRSSKKKVTFSNAEEIVKKASELKLNTSNSEGTNTSENMDTSEESVLPDHEKNRISESDDELLMSDSA